MVSYNPAILHQGGPGEIEFRRRATEAHAGARPGPFPSSFEWVCLERALPWVCPGGFLRGGGAVYNV